MANSKSNIYPIQLQGAELNLNKLDAEIKQYSGFNKNNSPFVGGCLSNVFTKEEQITGGNADNTYIDTNGDVYRVDTEGLWKNEQQIISYPNTTKFYERRKIVDNVNIVKLYSDKIYIDIIDGSYYAHWGNGYSEKLGTIKSSYPSFLDIAYKDGHIIFSYKRYWDSGVNVYAYMYVVSVFNENEEVHNRIAPSDYDTTSTAYVMKIRNMEGDYNAALPQATYFFDEVIINDERVTYAFVAFNEDNGNNGQEPPYRTGVLRIYFKPDSVNKVGTAGYYNSFFNNDPNVNIFTTLYCGYYMTSDGVFHFTHLPLYLSGTGFVYTPYVFPDFTADYKVAIKFKVALVSGSSTDYELSEVIKYDYYKYYADNEKCVKGKSMVNPSYYGFYNNTKNFFSPYGLHFSCAMKDRNSDKQLVISFSDRMKSFMLLSGSNDVYAGCCFFGDFKLLINEGKLTSISVCNYRRERVYSGEEQIIANEDSLHGVLLEDWGAIEDLVISHDGTKAIYKIGSSFYEIVRSDPKIHLKLNQIVVNCNSELNSYKLPTQEILHYGSDWNNSFLTSTTGRYGSLMGKLNAYSEGFTGFATAINEYNQKNNPSLILNPQNTVSMVNDVKDDFVFCDTAKKFYYKCPIDVFINNAYVGSLCDGPYINPSAVGTTFPTNTDGNIQQTPNLFSEFISNFGIDVFVRNNNDTYQLMKEGQENIMSYFLGTLVEGLQLVFIIQGQYYGIINNKLFGLQFNNGVIADTFFIVNVQGLQFVGNTPYEALFFSKTNRCLYSFTGANVLNQKQLVDKISEVRNYLYNPATQTVFLITDIGVLFYGLFGMFLLEYTNISNIFLLDNGIVMSDNSGNYRYIKYYLDEGDEGYTKENIRLETCFYGMNNEVVTINDCLYFRLFSEEHEEGDLKVKATTISLKGRQTEETTFKIKASDWDKITHTIYLRYQPKTQRGLGVSFSIDSPFKIASMSVGSQPDAVLVDRVSKGAITAPSVTTNNNEW